jgi:hypothetical protein
MPVEIDLPLNEILTVLNHNLEAVGTGLSSAARLGVGQERPICGVRAMSASPPKATGSLRCGHLYDEPDLHFEA